MSISSGQILMTDSLELPLYQKYNKPLAQTTQFTEYNLEGLCHFSSVAREAKANVGVVHYSVGSQLVVMWTQQLQIVQWDGSSHFLVCINQHHLWQQTTKCCIDIHLKHCISGLMYSRLWILVAVLPVTLLDSENKSLRKKVSRTKCK